MNRTNGPGAMQGPDLQAWVLPGILLGLAVHLPVAAQDLPDPASSVRQAVSAVCDAPSASLAEMAEHMPGGGTGLSEEALVVRGLDVGWQRRFALPGNAEIRVEKFAPRGALRRLAVEYWSAGASAGIRPRLAAIAGADCSIAGGRRLVYEAAAAQPVALEHLDGSLAATGEREPLNPPVPAGADPGGVAVALVDSGVNYLLPAIRERLARNDSGALLGYDYWDLDHRPFDANPARSPFFPQRHGTRTASVLLREAPEARLVPYRYPRPDMTRMADLVADAAAHGVRIVSIAMGSRDRDDWQALAEAAREHPEMLFVLSAGNDGRNIDEAPVYPAALPLDHTLVVTSSLPDGSLARGSNWGPQAVDLLVPAERLRALDFDGREVAVSGSSYAAPRIAALAARLLAADPERDAAALRAAILERVLPPFAGDAGRVSAGFLPRPEIAEQLPPLADTGDGRPADAARHTLAEAALYPDGPDTADARFTFEPHFAYFRGSGWGREALLAPARQLAGILAQCGIHIPRIELHVLAGPAAYHYFHEAIARELVGQVALPRPTVHFVTDTLQVDGWDAVAYGRSNTRARPALRDTVWFTKATRDPGIALAHELAHVLMDSGEHTDTPGNLMRAETSPENTALADGQCRAIIDRGTAHGLLKASEKR